jgi:Fe-S-cluster containining protein
MSDLEVQVRASADLCQSCGLCCDGTLFRVVQLKPQDDVHTLMMAGIAVMTDDNAGRFRQPCAAYQGCCRIYASRPSACRAYQCHLLKRYSNGAVTRTEAGAQIANLRLLREQLAIEVERVRPGMGRLSVAEIKKMIPAERLANDEDLHKLWAPVVMRLFALRRLEREAFQPPRRRDATDPEPDDDAVLSPSPE